MAQFGRDWFNRMSMVQEEMSQLLDHFSGSKPPMVRFSRSMWEPPIDMYETEDNVVVIVELAGVSEDDVEIVIDRETFTVQGKRTRIDPSAGKRAYYRMEIPSGPFKRAVRLPTPVDPTGVKAVCDRGLVEVILPKPKPKRIRPSGQGPE
jgi:HSP20 family protein